MGRLRAQNGHVHCLGPAYAALAQDARSRYSDHLCNCGAGAIVAGDGQGHLILTGLGVGMRDPVAAGGRAAAEVLFIADDPPALGAGAIGVEGDQPVDLSCARRANDGLWLPIPCWLSGLDIMLACSI
jgi:hypothetical protein